MGGLRDYVIRNRASWDQSAHEYEPTDRLLWAQVEPSWGEWGVPESELRLLPDELPGRDVIELGCGTGYVSAWLAPHCEVVAEPPREVSEQHSERVRLVIDHEQHGEIHGGGEWLGHVVSLPAVRSPMPRARCFG
jgi:SAM-dependent methyltransferase